MGARSSPRTPPDGPEIRGLIIDVVADDIANGGMAAWPGARTMGGRMQWAERKSPERG